MTKILSFGEIIWDVYPDMKTLGGAPLNFAAHIVRCGGGCTLVSAVGNDILGNEALAQVESFGVDGRYIQLNEYPTGQCCVSIGMGGVPSYSIVEDVAYDNIALDGHLRLNIGDFDVLYFGTLVQRRDRSRETLRKILESGRFSHIVCDVNLRSGCYDKESISLCLENATILKVSAEEEPILRELGGYKPFSNCPEAIAKAICEKYLNVRVVLVTMGKDGSYGYERATKKGYRQSARGERVVSTVGAGDSYLAAFVVGTLKDMCLENRMELAARVSGFVVGHKAAIPEYEINELYKI